MKMRARLALTLVLLLIAGASLFLYAARLSRPPDIATAFPRGFIVVGVDASLPPFAIDDGEAVSGLDIDLARAIAQSLELPIRFVNISYYGLFDALISAEVDLLVSALRVEAARADDLRYTRHYFDNGLILVRHSAEASASLDDLPDNLQGQKVAFELGSQADARLRQLEDQHGPVTRLPYELPSYALDALRLGQADAAIVDATALRLYQRRFPDWRSEAQYLTRDPYAIAVRRDNREAWQLVDAALATLKENGELARIIAKWL